MLQDELRLYICLVLRLNIALPSDSHLLPFLQELWSPTGNTERLRNARLQPYKQHLRQFMPRFIGYVEVDWEKRLEPVFFKLKDQCRDKVRKGRLGCSRDTAASEPAKPNGCVPNTPRHGCTLLCRLHCGSVVR